MNKAMQNLIVENDTDDIG